MVIHLQPRGVDRDLVASDEVVVELLRLNDAEIPAAPLAAALERIGRHVRGRVTLVDRGRVEAEYDHEGEIVAMRWPAGPIDADTGERTAEPGFFFTAIDGGVVGLMRTEADGDANDLLLPLLNSNAVAIVVADRSPMSPKAVGVARTTVVRAGDRAPASNAGVRLATRHIELFAPRIRGRTDWFFIPHDPFWEWLIVHELGHALRVPAAKERTYDVRGPHCIRPDCVMYSPADWRMVFQVLLHGWPLDFCDECAAELAAARELEPWTDVEAWGESSPNSAAMTIAPLPARLPAACACCGP